MPYICVCFCCFKCARLVLSLIRGQATFISANSFRPYAKYKRVGQVSALNRNNVDRGS
jgi:hypothetical protein